MKVNNLSLEERSMKSVSLTPAQLCLLETFAGVQSQEEADELSRVIRDFYARKLDEELEASWSDGTFDQKKLDEYRGRHFRTPYKGGGENETLLRSSGRD